MARNNNDRVCRVEKLTVTVYPLNAVQAKYVHIPFTHNIFITSGYTFNFQVYTHHRPGSILG